MVSAGIHSDSPHYRDMENTVRVTNDDLEKSSHCITPRKLYFGKSITRLRPNLLGLAIELSSVYESSNNFSINIANMPNIFVISYVSGAADD